MNLLLSLVSDVVDLKMLGAGQFMQNQKNFSPKKVLKFVLELLSI